MEGTKREKGKKEKKKKNFVESFVKERKRNKKQNFVYFKKNLNKCLLASLIGE